MKSAEVTIGQLRPLAERFFTDKEDRTVLLVRASAESPIVSLEVGGSEIAVIASDSPLQIRVEVQRAAGQRLVVLTPCTSEELGADLVARSVQRRVHSLDRWKTLCAKFGAVNPSRALTKEPELADALIEATSGGQTFAPVGNKTLDLDTVCEAAANHVFKLGTFSPRELWRWGQTADAGAAMQTADDEVVTQFEGLLTDLFGDGVGPLLRLVSQGDGANLAEFALCADVVSQVEEQTAISTLEQALDWPGFDQGRYQRFATMAMAELARDQTQIDPNTLNNADKRLAKWNLAGRAIVSDLLPSSFELRISDAAGALSDWYEEPANAGSAQIATDAMSRVGEHRRSRSEPHRLERLTMIGRVIARGGFGLEESGSVASFVSHYVEDGAWLDRARVRISQGDENTALRSLCIEIAAEAQSQRDAQGAAMAKTLSVAAGVLPSGVRGLENVLDEVVAPVAKLAPVLLVVLDGLPLSIFSEIAEVLDREGWNQSATPGGPAALAVLPTVTAKSRTSLFAGVVREGNKESEQRAFEAHPALLAASHSKDGKQLKPPTVFHKTELRAGGIDAFSPQIADRIADPAQHIVGVVINAIDERLKEVGQPPDGWALSELEPLKAILNAARTCGRATIITSDHGHILERDSLKLEGDGGGERWRSATPAPDPAVEILVSGARVVAPSNEAILPWREQVRYANKSNGYHGGLTPQELIVPVAVFSSEPIEGLDESASAPPTWWNVDRHVSELVDATSLDLAQAEATKKTKSASKTKRKRKTKPAPETQPMFDLAAMAPEPEPIAEVPATTQTQSLLDLVLGHPLLLKQLPVLRIDPDGLRAVLRELLRLNGTNISTVRVAALAGQPSFRAARFVGQLEKLLNIDGVEVLSCRDENCRLDQTLLKQQLGL